MAYFSYQFLPHMEKKFKKTLCVITTWNWKHLHDTQKKNAWNENVHTVNNRDLILKPGIISTYLGKSIAFFHAQKYYYFVWHFLFISLLCAIFQVPVTCSQSVQLKIRCQFFGSDVFFAHVRNNSCLWWISSLFWTVFNKL